MKNPKTVAGLTALLLLLIALGVVIAHLLPTVQAVRLEQSLTPTPEPAWPASVRLVTRDPAVPTAEPVLRSGMSGETVLNLQSRLYTLGYYRGEMDGQFGPGTRDAVLSFQRLNGLDADGIVGAETREVLYSAQAKPYRETENGQE